MKIEERADKLEIVDFNELEAYKIAGKIEKDGLFFYKKLYNSIDNPEVKKVIGKLLEEEEKHVSFFEECLYELRQEIEDGFEDDDLFSGLDSQIFEPYQSIENLNKVIDNPQKALKLGLIIEDKTIKFYQACRDMVSSEKVKAELDNIIREEKCHKSMLKKLI